MKKIFHNISSGFITRFILIVIGIFLPKIIIENVGSEFNGYLSTVSQLYVYIGLLEAGVGLTSTQALYKGVQDKDYNYINGVLSATNKTFRNNSKYYLMAFITAGIFLPFTVQSDTSKFILILIGLTIGLNGYLSFKYQQVYNSFLNAEGKIYIVTNVENIGMIIIYTGLIIMITSGINIVLAYLIYLVVKFFQIAFLNFYMKKNYPFMKFDVPPNYDAISQRNSVLVHQISTLVFNNTDAIILMYFVNLESVSVYSIYNMITHSVGSLISQFSNSFSFMLGQKFAEGNNSIYKTFNAYQFVFYIFSFSLMTELAILFKPFLLIYTKGFEDAQYIDDWLILLFIIKVIFQYSREPFGQLINVSGNFKTTQYRSVIETLINLLSSLIFVLMFGVKGVILGTVIAIAYRYVDMIVFSNVRILNVSTFQNFKYSISNVILLLLIYIFSNVIMVSTTVSSSVFILIIKALIWMVINFILFIVLNMFLFKVNLRKVYEMKKIL